jgi:glycolate dehydrogenase FAD-binding subunit
MHQALETSQVLKQLEDVVGRSYVVEHPPLRIGEVGTSLLVKPASSQEVAECIAVCARARVAVIPAGLMTWLDGGNPPRNADVVISLARMTRVIDYSPADLTATVEAGLTLTEFNQIVGRERQWLPLDPPGFDRASLGAIAACKSSGALRFGFGTVRDYVIGLKLAHADGTESKSGGRVVKNVAGYDMNKLYVGSFGTLAVLTQLTFKLRPLPEKISTVLIRCRSIQQARDAANLVLGPEMQPASVFLVRGLETCSETTMAVRFVDSERAVDHQFSLLNSALEQSIAIEVLTRENADSLWAAIADVDRDRSIAVRASVRMSAAASLFEEALSIEPSCIAAADLGVGVVRLAFDANGEEGVQTINRVRAIAERLGGSLFIEKAPIAIKRGLDVWGVVGPAGKLMIGLKEKFDPDSILNPGRFVCGI